MSQIQVLEMVQTEKATWIVKSIIDWFGAQVEANNKSPVAGDSFPRTAISTLIPMHQFCGPSSVEYEVVLHIEQIGSLITTTLARHHKDRKVDKKWAYWYQEEPRKEWNFHWEVVIRNTRAIKNRRGDDINLWLWNLHIAFLSCGSSLGRPKTTRVWHSSQQSVEWEVDDSNIASIGIMMISTWCSRKNWTSSFISDEFHIQQNQHVRWFWRTQCCWIVVTHCCWFYKSFLNILPAYNFFFFSIGILLTKA